MGNVNPCLYVSFDQKPEIMRLILSLPAILFLLPGYMNLSVYGEIIPIINPSFELGTTGWSGVTLGDYEYYAAPDGSHYAKRSANDGYTEQLTDHIIKPGETYTLTVWARSIYSDSHTNCLLTCPANGYPLGNPDTATAEVVFWAGSNEILSKSVVVNPKALQGAPERYTNDDGGNVWIDTKQGYRHAFSENHFYQPLSNDPILDPWFISRDNYQDGQCTSGAKGPVLFDGKKWIYGSNSCNPYCCGSGDTCKATLFFQPHSGGNPDYNWGDCDDLKYIFWHSGDQDPWLADGQVYYDSDTNRLWMVVGGGTGIFVVELDPESGYVKGYSDAIEYDTHMSNFVQVADWNGDNWTGDSEWFEGAALYKHNGYWYCFTSNGDLSVNYTIRVGRGINPTGPFYDKEGDNMNVYDPVEAEYGNSFLLGDDSDQLVPGHPHIWEEGETTYLGYDWRNAKEGHLGPGLDPFFDIFGIRKLYWVNDWPTIWVPITLTFNAYDYPESIGQALGIKMRNSGESSTYIAFDHLSLEYSLLPSPDIDGNDKVNLVDLASSIVSAKEVSFKVDKQYLCIPLSQNEEGPEHEVTLKVNDKNIFIEPMHFEEKGEQWWSNLDVSEYMGKTLTLHGAPEFAAGRIKLSNTTVGYPNLYKEANRPQIHFSFRHGSLGDPTAKFYYEPTGEWHMFYIYNPFRGGEVSWGHAVSKDMIHWEEKAPLFAFGFLIWNGTGFVDTENRLGLNKNGHQAIVLMQTHKGRQSGAFSYVISIDGGETFKKVEELREELNRPDLPTNPLVPQWHDAPRIYWSEEYQRYVLYLKHNFRVVHQYYSKDLKSWEQVEDVPAIPESFTFEGDPGEMVDMYLDGDPDKKYTVVMYGLHCYIVGRYGANGMLNLAGEPISKDDIVLTNHFGYPTIFHNPKDGRIIMNQNLGNDGEGGIPNYEIDHRPDASFPVELTLRSTAEGPRLFFNPIKEIEILYGKKHELGSRTVKNGQSRIEGLSGRMFRIKTEIVPGDAKRFGLDICGTKVTYDTRTNMLAVDENATISEPDRKRRKLAYDNGSISLDILVDTTSLEIFANNGMVHIPHGRRRYFEQEEFDASIFATDGSVTVKSLDVYELNSIWGSKKK
jgi:sucrose-6-phosphate hydrolase SacC (GH32 family)